MSPNVLLMISFYTCLFGYISYFGNIHIDLIKALVIIVALLSFTLTYILNDVHKMKLFYERTFNTHFTYKTVIVIDFIVHYLPAILLGFPENSMNYFVATFLILIWYIILQKQITKIYYPLLDYNNLIANKRTYSI